MAGMFDKEKKPLSKRMYTGSLFGGHGKGKIKERSQERDKARKKKYMSDKKALRATLKKDKKVIRSNPDWDNTAKKRLNKLSDSFDLKMDKLNEKYGKAIIRGEKQKQKDYDLIGGSSVSDEEGYGLRGAKARSFMTERGEKYSEPEGEYLEGVKVKKAGGGMTGVGLYPAEMARAGTMSQAKRKRYMKKGGGISYKMTGGQVVSHGYD